MFSVFVFHLLDEDLHYKYFRATRFFYTAKLTNGFYQPYRFNIKHGENKLMWNDYLVLRLTEKVVPS